MNAENKIKVIIADDHEIIREGLNSLLSASDEIEIIAEASGGRELIDVATRLKPDVVLTDLKMPVIDGIQAIKEITRLIPDTKSIALSTLDSDQSIVDALEAGAVGYVIKNAEKGEIVEAIKTVHKNLPYYCKQTTLMLAKQISKSKFNPFSASAKCAFSDNELAIIRLICQQQTSEEIGRLLFMSARTVEGHRAKILEKVNEKSTVGIVIFAIKNGIVLL